MAANGQFWREAAGIILVAPKSVSFTPTNSVDTKCMSLTGARETSKTRDLPDEFDVLMLKRSNQSSFSNIYVFAGGNACNADFSPEWLDVFNLAGVEKNTELFQFFQKGGPGVPMFRRRRDKRFSAFPSEIAFRICAIRETFEEAGVLLVRKVADINKIDSSFLQENTVLGCPMLDCTQSDMWRQRIYNNPEEFVTMCKQLRIIPDVWSLYEWSNWLTPVHGKGDVPFTMKQRFDVFFFICCMDEKPIVVEDKRETVHFQWGTPVEILEKFQNGSCAIVEPQIYDLCRLAKFSRMQELLRFFWAKSPQRIERTFPVRCSCCDGFIYIQKGDDLYPSSPDTKGVQEVVQFAESLDELAVKFPNHNRCQYWCTNKNDDNLRFAISCNVSRNDGHADPLIEFSVVKTERPKL